MPDPNEPVECVSEWCEWEGLRKECLDKAGVDTCPWCAELVSAAADTAEFVPVSDEGVTSDG